MIGPIVPTYALIVFDLSILDCTTKMYVAKSIEDLYTCKNIPNLTSTQNRILSEAVDLRCRTWEFTSVQLLECEVFKPNIQVTDSSDYGFMPLKNEMKNYCLTFLSCYNIPDNLLELIDNLYYFRHSLNYHDYAPNYKQCYFIFRLMDGRWLNSIFGTYKFTISPSLVLAVQICSSVSLFSEFQADMLLNLSVNG